METIRTPNVGIQPKRMTGGFGTAAILTTTVLASIAFSARAQSTIGTAQNPAAKPPAVKIDPTKNSRDAFWKLCWHGASDVEQRELVNKIIETGNYGASQLLKWGDVTDIQSQRVLAKMIQEKGGVCDAGNALEENKIKDPVAKQILEEKLASKGKVLKFWFSLDGFTRGALTVIGISLAMAAAVGAYVAKATEGWG